MTAYITEHFRLYHGDALTVLGGLPDCSVNCCVTSPPYWGLRDYGVAGQLGLEKTPDAYVAKMVEVFREARRVLRDDGTLWLNLGDCYCHGTPGGGSVFANGRKDGRKSYEADKPGGRVKVSTLAPGLKQKDLIGIPWMVAFALRADGWYLRSEITWCKKAPMPESVQDRPTSATEKVFLLSKSGRYHYNAAAVRNAPSESFLNDSRWKTGPTPENEKSGYEASGAQNPKQIHRIFDKQRGHSRRHAGFNDRWDHMSKDQQQALGSNMRNYWVLGPQPYPDAHFATFPTEIPRKAILAGCPVGGVVLDPFAGSGTTGQVAIELGRKAWLIELNPSYLPFIHRRCDNAQPILKTHDLFNESTEPVKAILALRSEKV